MDIDGNRWTVARLRQVAAFFNRNLHFQPSAHVVDTTHGRPCVYISEAVLRGRRRHDGWLNGPSIRQRRSTLSTGAGPMTTVRILAFVLAVLIGALPRPLMAQSTILLAERVSSPAPIGAMIDLLTQGSFALTDASSVVMATRRRGEQPNLTVSERTIVDTFRDNQLTADQGATLWEFFADDENNDLATLPIIQALTSASTSSRARDALWSELAAIARRFAGKPLAGARERTLLGTFERHRRELLPLLPTIRETESGGDEMAHLMTSTLVFGDDIWQSLFDMVKRNPGAVARLIERERERGRPVKWEFQGFEGLMRWKDAHLVAGAPQAPASLQSLDAAGETFITIFNALHSLDDWYREQMLRGLGPIELFNAAVGGEQELYRLGTSGYRNFLHPIILKGIKDSGSLEAFLEKAAPRGLGETAVGTGSRRGLVFVRIASSFGLLDSVLDAVRDRDRFVADAIAALGDPRSFESSGSTVVDLVTGNSKSPQALMFKRVLLERLYELYRDEASAARRSVYGSMLSAYQTVTGDHRDRTIDREFPLDQSMQRLPFKRMFKHDGKAGFVHRIFMRLHDDIDAVQTFASFRVTMRSLGASVREEKHFTLFRLGFSRRRIEIYANKPDGAGMRQGITDIARSLRGNGIETIVGRGHTGIITPLQTDARRLLGDRLSGVAAVIVGTCGGDASVRDMIGTFGYVPFVTTKSTGRQLINNAIMQSYIAALLALAPGDTLSMSQVLDRALARFLKDKGDEELREDARLYKVNLGTVLVARLFDTHVRRHVDLQP